jgi:hypothetical protein
MSNLFFDKFKNSEDMANSFIDPAMIKEELCDKISGDNCDLNFSGINDKYVDRIKVEENSETVFAENFDLKDEHSKETNYQNESDYDPLTSLTISADEAYQYYKKNGEKGKGATFANVKKILEWKNVEIKQRPKSDPALDKKWQSERYGIVRDFDRILQNMNRKRKGNKSAIKCFFESSKYQTLTYPYSNPEIRTQEIVSPEILNSEVLNPEILNPENNASYQFLKP